MEAAWKLLLQCNSYFFSDLCPSSPSVRPSILISLHNSFSHTLSFFSNQTHTLYHIYFESSCLKYIHNICKKTRCSGLRTRLFDYPSPSTVWLSLFHSFIDLLGQWDPSTMGFHDLHQVQDGQLKPKKREKYATQSWFPSF
jgi:hypothetical protein